MLKKRLEAAKLGGKVQACQWFCPSEGISKMDGFPLVSLQNPEKILQKRRTHMGGFATLLIRKIPFMVSFFLPAGELVELPRHGGLSKKRL